MDALHDKTECIAMTAWKKVKQQNTRVDLWQVDLPGPVDGYRTMKYIELHRTDFQ